MTKFNYRFIFIAVGILAALFIVFGWTEHTSWQPDSYYYSGAAENLAKGLGLSVANKSTGKLESLVHYPPLTSAVAAFFISLFGVSASTAMMLISVVSLAFISSTSLYQLIQHKPISKTNLVFSLASVVSIVSSKHLLEAFQMQQSEPLFLMLIVLYVILLHYYLKTHMKNFLILSAIVAGFAFLTRYIGAFTVISSSILFLINTRKSFLQKIIDIFAFGAIFAIFFIGLFARNYLTSGTLSSHTMTEGAGSRIFEAIHSSTLFILPGSFPSVIRVPAFIAFVMIGCVLLICLPRQKASRCSSSQTVYIVSAFTYIVFQVTMCLCVTTRLNTRTLLPFYLLLFIGFATALNSRLSIKTSDPKNSSIKKFAVTFMCLFAILSLARGVEQIHQNRTTQPFQDSSNNRTIIETALEV